MGIKIDWAKLTAENRVKAPGISWNEEELKAIYKDGVDPDDVRAGILTKEEAEKEPKSLERMKKEDLIDIAKEIGIEFDERAVTKGDLILEIRKSGELNKDVTSLERMKKGELIDMAKEMKIEIEDKMTKEELITLIRDGEENA